MLLSSSFFFFFVKMWSVLLSIFLIFQDLLIFYFLLFLADYIDTVFNCLIWDDDDDFNCFIQCNLNKIGWINVTDLSF